MSIFRLNLFYWLRLRNIAETWHRCLLRIIMILKSFNKAFTAYWLKANSAGETTIYVHHIGADHAQKLMIAHCRILYFALHKHFLGNRTFEVVLCEFVFIWHIMTIKSRIISTLFVLLQLSSNLPVPFSILLIGITEA